jgi:hypothetical protein
VRVCPSCGDETSDRARSANCATPLTGASERLQQTRKVVTALFTTVFLGRIELLMGDIDEGLNHYRSVLEQLKRSIFESASPSPSTISAKSPCGEGTYRGPCAWGPPRSGSRRKWAAGFPRAWGAHSNRCKSGGRSFHPPSSNQNSRPAGGWTSTRLFPRRSPPQRPAPALDDLEPPVRSRGRSQVQTCPGNQRPSVGGPFLYPTSLEASW